MISKIEQMIEEIEEYIGNCKYQPLSNTKIVVNREHIEELLAELKEKTPDEIERHRKIVNNKEAIIAKAHKDAEEIRRRATEQSELIISEHQLVEKAYAQANDMLRKAQGDAQNIAMQAQEYDKEMRIGAVLYTDEMLNGMQEMITAAISDIEAKYAAFLSSMQGFANTLAENRKTLAPLLEEESLEELLDPTAEQVQQQGPKTDMAASAGAQRRQERLEMEGRQDT